MILVITMKKSKMSAPIKKDKDKEYLMLRAEVDNSLARQDKFFLLIFSILGLGNAIGYQIENIGFLILILYLTVFIQLRIIEARQSVFYISTYQIAYLERESEISFEWETRIKQFKDSKWKSKNRKHQINRKISSLFIRFGNAIKNFSIGILAIFIYLRVLVNLYNMKISAEFLSISNAITFGTFVIATIAIILNIIYSVIICTDRYTRSDYIEKWESLRKQSVAPESLISSVAEHKSKL